MTVRKFGPGRPPPKRPLQQPPSQADREPHAIDWRKACVDGRRCGFPNAAPGWRWTCPDCHHEWVAASAGPLDIEWVLFDETKERE